MCYCAWKSGEFRQASNNASKQGGMKERKGKKETNKKERKKEREGGREGGRKEGRKDSL